MLRRLVAIALLSAFVPTSANAQTKIGRGLSLGEPQVAPGGLWYEDGNALAASGCTAPDGSIIGPALSFDSVPPDYAGASVGPTAGLAAGPAFDGVRGVMMDVNGTNVTLYDVTCANGAQTVAQIDASAVVPDPVHWELSVVNPLDTSGRLYLRYAARDTWKQGIVRVDENGAEAVLDVDDFWPLLFDELLDFHPWTIPEGQWLTIPTIYRGGFKIRHMAVAPDDTLWMTVGWTTTADGAAYGQHQYLATWLVQRLANGELVVRSRPQSPAQFPTYWAQMTDHVAPVWWDDHSVFVLPQSRVSGSINMDEAWLWQNNLTMFAPLDAPDGWRKGSPIAVDLTEADLWTVVGDTSGKIYDTQGRELSLDPSIADLDMDGLSEAREQELGTNPRLADSDGDGADDGTEVSYTQTSPTVASGEVTDIVFAPSTFIHDADLVNGFDPYTCSTCLGVRSRFDQTLCVRGNCYGPDGESIFTTDPSSELYLTRLMENAVFAPSGNYAFAWYARDSLAGGANDSALFRVDLRTKEIEEFLTPQDYGIVYVPFVMPFDDSHVLVGAYIEGKIWRVESQEVTKVVDLDDEECPYREDGTCADPTDIFGPPPYRDLNVLGWDANRGAYLFEIATLDGWATMVAVDENGAKFVTNRRRLREHASPGRVESAPDGSMLFSGDIGTAALDQGSVVSPSFAISPTRQLAAEGLMPWYRHGFLAQNWVGYTSQVQVTAGDCYDSAVAFTCDGAIPVPDYDSKNFWFLAEWMPITATGPQPGEIVFQAGSRIPNGPPEFDSDWRLWRIGTKGQTLPWLNAWEFAALMDEATRPELQTEPLGPIADMGFAPDMSQLCLVEPRFDRVWLVRLRGDGRATGVERIDAPPGVGGCDFDDAGNLGLASSQGVTVSGSSTPLMGLNDAGPLLHRDGRWIALEKSGPEFEVTFGAAWCVSDDAATQTPGTVLTVGPSSVGVTWLDATPVEYKDSSLSATEARTRSFIGSVDTFCTGEGPKEMLVARQPPPREPINRNLSLISWIYVNNLGTVTAPAIVSADGGSIVGRDDNVVFFAGVNAHPAGQANHVVIEVTPDVLIRVRPDFTPETWDTRIEALDAYRRTEGRALIHWPGKEVGKLQNVAALTLAPGGTHDNDYGVPTEPRVDLEDEPDMGGETPEEPTQTEDDGCCATANAPARTTPWPLLLGLGIAAFVRRRR